MEEVRAYVARSLGEALEIIKEKGAMPLAGGTDLMVQGKKGVGITPTFSRPVVIISHVEELKGVSLSDDGSVRIGALATPGEIASSEIVPWFVRQAASRMGAPALRNTATIGGNIGNASPKGDLPQPLVLLDAEVVLVSTEGERRMKLDDFILGSKKTALAEGEIIKEVIVPKTEWTWNFYRKIGARRSNAISKLSLSCLIRAEDGLVADFRACSGAAGPRVIRSRETENLVKGLRIEDIPSVIDEVAAGWDAAISPHAMPEWRRNSTRRMLEHFLEECSKNPEPGEIA